LEGKTGWAFGIGIERIAIILFDIPDIRYFHSNDERFLKQFKSGEIIKFKPYSKYPSCYKDISFWLSDNFNYNDLCEIVRERGGDLIETVELIDSFTNDKTNKTSHCYRITYRSNERSLLNEEIDIIQNHIEEDIENKLLVVLR